MLPRMYLHKVELSLTLGNDKLAIASICFSLLGVLRWMNEPLFRSGSGGAERSRAETGRWVLNRRVSRICFQPCLFVRMIHAERFRVRSARIQISRPVRRVFPSKRVEKPLRRRVSSFGSPRTTELLVMASLGKRGPALPTAQRWRERGTFPVY